MVWNRGSRRGGPGAAWEAVEALEPRCLLAAVFGPIQNTPIVTRVAIVADVDGDGIADRISAAQAIRLERGVGDGTFLAPSTLAVPGSEQVYALTAGRFRGPGGPVLIAAMGHYAATNTAPSSPRNAGYALRILAYAPGSDRLIVLTRLEVPFGQLNQALESPVLLAGDVRAGLADELIVSTSIIRDPRAFLQPPGGRVVVSVFAMPAYDRLELKAALMDRTFVAPAERFRVPRAQLADVNGDGRTDVLVRPATAWRAELGPAARMGPQSQVDFTRRAIPGSDEAAAGGRFVFADVTGDSVVDRVLIRTSAPVVSVIDQGSTDVFRVMNISMGINVERGLGGGLFGSRTLYDTHLVTSVWSVRNEEVGNSWSLSPEQFAYTPLIGDVDGDGLVDFVIQGTVRSRYVPASRPDQFSFEDTSFISVFGQSSFTSFLPQSAPDVIREGQSVRVIGLTDVNGDTRPDLLFISNGGSVLSGQPAGLSVRLNIAG